MGDEEHRGSGIAGWINERLHPRVGGIEGFKPGMKVTYDARLRNGNERDQALQGRLTEKDEGQWSDAWGEYVVTMNDGTTTEWVPEEHGGSGQIMGGLMERDPAAAKKSVRAKLLVPSGASLTVVDRETDENRIRLYGQRAYCEVAMGRGVALQVGGPLTRGGYRVVELADVASIRPVSTTSEESAMTPQEFLHSTAVMITADEANYFRKA